MKKLMMILFLMAFLVLSQSAQAIEVPLVAGQDMLVGHVDVTIIDDEGVPSLRVEYLLDVDIYEGDGEECLTSEFLELAEIHLHVAYEAGLIPTNNKGLPKIGHFEYSDVLNIIPLDEIPGDDESGVIYVAAHAVVSNWDENCDICDEVVEDEVDLEMTIFNKVPTGDSYFEITIGGELLPAWCADYDHSMSLGLGEAAYPFDLEGVRRYSASCADGFLTADFWTEIGSGYGVLGGIERPENLPLIVWILNQWQQGNAVALAWIDVDIPKAVLDIQRVIWHLLEDVDEIPLTNAAQAAILVDAEEGIVDWVPGCCDYTAVILAPQIPADPELWDLGPDNEPNPAYTDPQLYGGEGYSRTKEDDQIRQIMIMLVPAPCCFDETAWGLLGYPDEREGILFAPEGGNGKISGSWAEYFEFPLP